MPGAHSGQKFEDQNLPKLEAVISFDSDLSGENVSANTSDIVARLKGQNLGLK